MSTLGESAPLRFADFGIGAVGCHGGERLPHWVGEVYLYLAALDRADEGAHAFVIPRALVLLGSC